MPLKLTFEAESFPIAGIFTIARGSKTKADVLTVTVEKGAFRGRGECVPYRRYGETMESVIAEVEAARPTVEAGITRAELLTAMSPGAARNAIDCALWDLEAKSGVLSVADALEIETVQPLLTAYTLSLAEPAAMAAQARANADRPLLKMKVGGAGDDMARVRAVAAAAPQSRLILDANEGWTAETIVENLAAAAELGVALVEQPLPAAGDALLGSIPHAVPICADESLHVAADLDRLVGLYDAVNIKLDKAGGLTEAIALRDRARALGLGVMVGCMVGTSLAMAPAVLLAQDADFVDLDGPLLLARDRVPGLSYAGSLVLPPEPALWG